MKFFIWIYDQIEWVKSLFSEKEKVDGKQVASTKRIATLTVLYMFAHSIEKVGESTSWVSIPNIEWEWAVMIGGILGITVYDSLQKKKMNGEDGTKDVEQK